MWYLQWTLIFAVALFSRNVLADGPPRVGDHKHEPVPAEFRELADGVGILVGSRGAFCTAFCLKSNVIGTNAHCIDAANRARSYAIERFTFQLSGKKGQRSPIDGVGNNKRLNTVVGTTRISVLKAKEQDQSHYDWGIARLKKPICKGRELPVANLPLLDLYVDENELISIFFQRVGKWPRLRYSKCDSGPIRRQPCLAEVHHQLALSGRLCPSQL